MRKYIFYILSNILLFVGCKTSEIGVDKEDLLVVSTEAIKVDCDATTVAVEVSSLCSYSISSTEKWSWIKPSYKRSDRGTSKVLFTISENTELTSRSATITIKNSNYGVHKTISVEQDGCTPYINTSIKELSASFEGTEEEITIESNIDYIITSSESWCRVDRTTGQVGKSALKISINANVDISARTATIALANKAHNHSSFISVSQMSREPFLSIGSESLLFDTFGGTQMIDISTNVEYQVKNDADWLTFAQTESGLAVTASPYADIGKANRTCTITISNEKHGFSHTINVSQESCEPMLNVKSDNLSFSADGGEQKIDILANIEYQVIHNVDWLVIAKTGSGITVSASPYTEVTERTTNITILNENYGQTKNIKVTQSAFTPVVNASPASLSFGQGGSTKSIEINSNVKWQASCKADWVTLSTTSNESQTATMQVKVLQNTNNSAREASIEFYNEEYNYTQTIPITQAGFAPSISISTTSISASASGKSYSTTVTSNISWKASCSASWVTIYPSSGQSGSTSISFTIAKNSSTSSRSTKISIKNNDYDITKTISIYQSGSDPSISIGTTSISAPASGKSYSTTITSAVSWNASCSASWVSISPSSGQSGSTAITIVVAKNSSTSSRSTKISIKNNDYDITKTISISQGVETSYSILYTSYDGEVVTPRGTSSFGANIVSNTYTNGQGVITFDGKITKIGSSAFSNCSTLTSITIPNGVTEIGYDAFYWCTSLRSISIPNSVTKIGDDAFYSCSSLTSVSIPNSVTEIGVSAFSCCGLTSVTIPNGVTSIRNGTFAGCSALTSVTIPNSVTQINGYAFDRCLNLAQVYCKAKTPPTTGYRVFDGTAITYGLKIYVPRNSVETYKSSEYWSNYADYIVGYDF